MGLWPIAGITTIGVPEDAHATIREAIHQGITTDTAYSYGYDGESDRLLGQYVHSQRDDFRIIGKVGQRWNGQRKRVVNGTPEQLTLDAEESVRRLGIECFDLLMLHSIDPNVPLERSMITMCELHRRGLCRDIGICNVHAAELSEAQRIAELESIRLHAIQCPLNLIRLRFTEGTHPQCKAKRHSGPCLLDVNERSTGGEDPPHSSVCRRRFPSNYDMFQVNNDAIVLC